MLIHQGEARNHQLNRRLAFTLATVAGGLNAAAYHAVGFFSANMTGNVSSLSNFVALGQWARGFGYLLIVLTFISGAVVSTLVIDAGLRRGVATIYARVVLAEAAMLVALSSASVLVNHADEGGVLILGFSFLMGLQNAIVTHISDAQVRTTHVSGMATDIGIGLARLIAMARRKGPSAAEEAAVITRLRLHSGTVIFFLTGGVAGVLAYRWMGEASFALGALPLVAVAVPAFFEEREVAM